MKNTFKRSLPLFVLFNLLWLGFPTTTFAKDVAPPSSLAKKDTKVGKGVEATSGKMVSVHYTGWLWKKGKPGDKFDSSVDRKEPFQFLLGGAK